MELAAYHSHSPSPPYLSQGHWARSPNWMSSGDVCATCLWQPKCVLMLLLLMLTREIERWMAGTCRSTGKHSSRPDRLRGNREGIVREGGQEGDWGEKEIRGELRAKQQSNKGKGTWNIMVRWTHRKQQKAKGKSRVSSTTLQWWCCQTGWNFHFSNEWNTSLHYLLFDFHIFNVLQPLVA